MTRGKQTLLLMLLLLAVASAGYFTYVRLLAPAGPRPLQAAAVEILPDFTLSDLDGEPRSIREWADGHGLVINFWATWCAPCLREIPLLIDFQSEHHNPAVQVVGIAVDRFEDVAAFVPQMSLNYPVLVGESDAMAAAQAFGVEFLALPFTVFAGPEGQVLAVHTGEVIRGDLDNYAAVLTDLNAGAITAAEARARMAGRL